MYKECNNCGRDECDGRAIKALGCNDWIPVKVARYNMVEMAAYRELVQFGAIENVSKALSKRRLGI